MLEAAAFTRPRMIVLDDLQWADRGTLGAVMELIPRLTGLPLMWVLASRSGPARGDFRDLVVPWSPMASG